MLTTDDLQQIAQITRHIVQEEIETRTRSIVREEIESQTRAIIREEVRDIVREEVEVESKNIRREIASNNMHITSQLIEIKNKIKNIEIDTTKIKKGIAELKVMDEKILDNTGESDILLGEQISKLDSRITKLEQINGASNI